MKYDCDVILDLLPLYQDGVCSEASKKVVQEHLQECSKCRQMEELLQADQLEVVLAIEKKRVLETHEKKEKRRSLTVGVVTAGVLTIPILVCLICNLVVGHSLDWFFIVLTSLLMVASVTVVPMLVTNRRFLWTFCSFLGSLLLLLLSVGIYCKAGVMYWKISLFTTGYCVIAGLVTFGILHSGKCNHWLKAGLCTGILGTFTAFGNEIVNRCCGIRLNGSVFDADLSQGFPADNNVMINSNSYFLILLLSLLLGIGFCLIGWKKRKDD